MWICYLLLCIWNEGEHEGTFFLILFRIQGTKYGENTMPSSEKLMGSLWQDLSSKFLNCLKNLRSLTTLKVDGARVSHSIFETISITCKSLVEIGLSKCIGLTDTYVTELVTGCSNLKTLNLSCCDSITDDAISAIADSCRELVSLQLESCNFITERSLKLLGL